MITVSHFWSESIVTVYGLLVFQSVKYTNGLLSSVVIHIHIIQGIKISYIHHNVTLSKNIKVDMLKFQQLGTFHYTNFKLGSSD